eukprot:TRINITY_DN8667_c0_g1_i4.p1 TRINITY_DN8667_c0_g1~~TRINITY_DN8667_c0_g1_i4.p1  ORF type:complete len:181 (-),score=5.32 TRINITY_DN8667_c0_g1_i4:15-557(-)
MEGAPLMRNDIKCPFYTNLGVCRLGDRCTRIHENPVRSKTILLKNLACQIPYSAECKSPVTIDWMESEQKHFEEFYRALFVELRKFGTIKGLHICVNKPDFLFGNVYVKFRDSDAAKNALEYLSGLFFNRRLIIAELSPANKFHEMRCRQNDFGDCSRGQFCSFVHIRRVNPHVLTELNL